MRQASKSAYDRRLRLPESIPACPVQNSCHRVSSDTTVHHHCHRCLPSHLTARLLELHCCEVVFRVHPDQDRCPRTDKPLHPRPDSSRHVATRKPISHRAAPHRVVAAIDENTQSTLYIIGSHGSTLAHLCWFADPPSTVDRRISRKIEPQWAGDKTSANPQTSSATKVQAKV